MLFEMTSESVDWLLSRISMVWADTSHWISISDMSLSGSSTLLNRRTTHLLEPLTHSHPLHQQKEQRGRGANMHASPPPEALTSLFPAIRRKAERLSHPWPLSSVRRHFDFETVGSGWRQQLPLALVSF